MFVSVRRDAMVACRNARENGYGWWCAKMSVGKIANVDT